MIPIIVTKGADGKLDITEEQLKKLIDCAYHSGYADGIKAQQSTPIINPYPLRSSDDWKITCEQAPTVTLQI